MKYALLLLIVLPACAQRPQPASQNADVEKCAALRKHGDAGAAACYQGLTRSANRAVQAEGYWGLKNYNAANDAFRDAVKARPKDATLRARWGLLYHEHWQPGDAVALFREALEIDDKNPEALLGMARVAEDQFEGEAAKYAQKALDSNPKLFEARELLARDELEDNNEMKAGEEANKALAISP